MFESFESFVNLVFNSIDDIFISAALFLLMRVLSNWVYWCMNSYFRVSVYVSDIINFGLWFVLIVLVSNHLFGTEISTSLFSGFSIGMGYAFQPYIVSMFTGVFTGFMVREGDTILFEGNSVIVKKISLFHVSVSSGEYIQYIPHAYFTKSPLIIKS